MQTRRRGQTPTASFFVRLWLEVNAKAGQWRGQVRHVQSGETAYFVDAQDLLSFLAAHGGQAFIPTREEVNHDVVSDHANAPPGELPD
jgi:hypothetical protein